MHDLKLEDYQRRVRMCRDLLHRISAGELTVERLLMTDEAVFHLNGFVNMQNARFYAMQNPREIRERPVNGPKVMVWAGLHPSSSSDRSSSTVG